MGASQVGAGTAKVIAIVVATALVVGGAVSSFFLLRDGGSSSDHGEVGPVEGTAPTTTEPELTSEVLIDAPSDWETTDSDRTAAADASDLTADLPEAQRVRIVSDTTSSPEDLDAGGIDDVLDDADDTTIDGHDAVSVTVRKGAVVQRWLFVALGNGDSQAVLLEAPEASWESDMDDMHDMLEVV